MKTIVALYEERRAAKRAISELVTRGIARDRISLVSPADASEARSTQLRLDDEPEPAEAGASPRASTTAAGMPEDARPAESVASTVAIGSMVLGAAFLTLPAVGPVLAAGPLLAGIAIGGAQAGGEDLSPCLHKSGVPPSDAERYANAVRRGHALVVVTASDDEANDVARSLARHSPIAA
jgi:hypothetical protein